MRLTGLSNVIVYCADYRCSQVSDRETDESIQAGHRSVAMRRDSVRRDIHIQRLSRPFGIERADEGIGAFLLP